MALLCRHSLVAISSLFPHLARLKTCRVQENSKKSADCAVYLPIWTPEEIGAVAGVVHGLDQSHEPELVTRFKKYGGIPRSIFQKLNVPEDISKEWFTLSDPIFAVTEVGSGVVDQRKVSGQILHLIPDETLQNCTYQWGSNKYHDEVI